MQPSQCSQQIPPFYFPFPTDPELVSEQFRVDYNGQPLDIYQPIRSNTAQLPIEPVKDGRPLSAKKDRYVL